MDERGPLPIGIGLPIQRRPNTAPNPQKSPGEEARRRQAGRTHHNRCNRFPSAAICTKLASKRSLMFCRSPSTLALDLLIAVAPALWLEGGALSVGKCFGAAIGARK